MPEANFTFSLPHSIPNFPVYSCLLHFTKKSYIIQMFKKHFRIVLFIILLKAYTTRLNIHNRSKSNTIMLTFSNECKNVCLIAHYYLPAIGSDDHLKWANIFIESIFALVGKEVKYYRYLLEINAIIWVRCSANIFSLHFPFASDMQHETIRRIASQKVLAVVKVRMVYLFLYY